jgi:peroxiredoxin
MKTFLTVLLFTLTTACVFAQSGARTSLLAKKEKVTLRGKIGSLNPPAQLWYYMGDERWDTIPVKNGEFNITKETMLPAYGALMIRYSPYGKDSKESFFANMNLQNMYFDPGVINLNSPTDTLKGHLNVTGPGATSFLRYKEMWNKEDLLIKEQRKLAAEFNNASPEQLRSTAYQQAYETKNEELENKITDLLISEIKKDPNGLVAIMAFASFVKRTAESLTSEQQLKVFDQLGETYRNSVHGKAMKAFILGEDPNDTEASADSNTFMPVGSIMPDFVQNDTNGNPVKLSAFRGKYVLIDFWASWCVPCRNVNPQLVKLYEQYKPANFEVLGVSLDKDKSAWEAAIKQDKLPWQQVSDLRGGENAVAKQFKVNTIPMSFLLDPDGRIILKGRSLKVIERELQKRLGK